MAMLYDKGLFKYEDKISKYWPEFGKNSNLFFLLNVHFLNLGFRNLILLINYFYHI